MDEIMSRTPRTAEEKIKWAERIIHDETLGDAKKLLLLTLLPRADDDAVMRQVLDEIERMSADCSSGGSE